MHGIKEGKVVIIESIEQTDQMSLDNWMSRKAVIAVAV